MVMVEQVRLNILLHLQRVICTNTFIGLMLPMDQRLSFVWQQKVGFSAKAAAKIILIKIIDTSLQHYAYETISKIYTTNRDWQICEAHGRCDLKTVLKIKSQMDG